MRRKKIEILRDEAMKMLGKTLREEEEEKEKEMLWFEMIRDLKFLFIMGALLMAFLTFFNFFPALINFIAYAIIYTFLDTIQQ